MNVLARIVCQQRASPFLRFTIQLFHGRVLGLRTLPVISVPVSSLELFFFVFLTTDKSQSCLLLTELLFDAWNSVFVDQFSECRRTSSECLAR